MKRLFGRRDAVVEVCERCASACDPACRADALVERQRVRALEHAVRPV